MFISKKSRGNLEKKVADIEKQIQSQPLEEIIANLASSVTDAIDSISHTPQE